MYENYAKIRDAKGLKDYDVSKATGISSGTLSDWKKGRYNLKYDKLRKIANFLGVPVESFDSVQTNAQMEVYYLNEGTGQEAQRAYDDPYMRILFDAAQGSRPEDIQMAADLLTRLKKTNRDG